MDKITKKQFLATAPEVLEEAGVVDPKIQNAIAMLTLQLESNKLQEL